MGSAESCNASSPLLQWNAKLVKHSNSHQKSLMNRTRSFKLFCHHFCSVAKKRNVFTSIYYVVPAETLRIKSMYTDCLRSLVHLLKATSTLISYDLFVFKCPTRLDQQSKTIPVKLGKKWCRTRSCSAGFVKIIIRQSKLLKKKIVQLIDGLRLNSFTVKKNHADISQSKL